MKSVFWLLVYSIVFLIGITIAYASSGAWLDLFAIATGHSTQGRIISVESSAGPSPGQASPSQASPGEQAPPKKSTAKKSKNTKNTKRERETHDFEIRYRFEHAGRQRTGRGYHVDGTDLTLSAEESQDALLRYSEGANVTVYFDPDDPNRSALTKRPSSRMWFGAILSSTLIGLVVMAAILRRRGGTEIKKTAVRPELALPPSRLPLEELLPLVERYEQDYTADPTGYQTRLLRFRWIAPVAVLGSLAVLLGVFALVATNLPAERRAQQVKTLVILCFAVGVVARATFVREPPIEGVRLRPEQAPKLFAMVDELVDRAAGDPIHEVFVDASLNARILSRPRLGVFGLWRNSLVVGLRLMASMPPSEFRAVLAHEIGHISARHGVTSRLVYRQRAFLLRLVERIATKTYFGASWVRGFYSWFTSRFDARALVLSRRHELHADAIAVESVGPRTAADALIRVAHVADLEKRLFEETLKARIRAEPNPPDDPLELVREIARTPIPAFELQRRLDHALAVGTDPYDSHPCLAERIASFNVPARTPAPFGQDAADALLQPSLAFLSRRAFDPWIDSIGPTWVELHEDWQSSLERCLELDAKTVRTVDEEFERARIVEQRDGPTASLPIYDTVVERAPSHIAAAYHAARIRLEAGHIEASNVMLDIIAKDPDFAAPGYRAIARCLEHLDRTEESIEWYERAATEFAEDERAILERATTTLENEMVEHDLPAAQLDALLVGIRTIPKLGSAWLAKRVVNHRPHRKCYVVGLESARLTTRFLGLARQTEAIRLVAAFETVLASLELDFHCYVVGLDHQPSRARKKLQRVRNARLELHRPTPGA